MANFEVQFFRMCISEVRFNAIHLRVVLLLSAYHASGKFWGMNGS
jgi:hypothetical protein